MREGHAVNHERNCIDSNAGSQNIREGHSYEPWPSDGVAECGPGGFYAFTRAMVVLMSSNCISSTCALSGAGDRIRYVLSVSCLM